MYVLCNVVIYLCVGMFTSARELALTTCSQNSSQTLRLTRPAQCFSIRTSLEYIIIYIQNEIRYNHIRNKQMMSRHAQKLISQATPHKDMGKN